MSYAVSSLYVERDLASNFLRRAIHCTQSDTSHVTSRQSRSGVLLDRISNALDNDNQSLAVRLADRACRLFASSLTFRLIRSRIFLQSGRYGEAIAGLTDCVEPDAVVARCEALLACGEAEQAAAECDELLRRVAVDTVDHLDALALAICRALPAVCCSGWAGIDSTLRIVGHLRSGSNLLVAGTGGTYSPNVSLLTEEGFHRYYLDLDCNCFHEPMEALTKPGKILGSALGVPADFGVFGWVAVEENRLTGRVRLDWAPGLPVSLLIEQGEKRPLRLPVPADLAGKPDRPFSVELHGWDLHEPICVSVILPDGRQVQMTGSPLRLGARAALSLRRDAFHERPRMATDMVDVIVPVYTHREESLKCIQNVLKTTSPSNVRVVVVDDASPDEALHTDLAELSKQGLITLVVNKVNLGFPGAVNRGMGLHPDRDVVLLNSDACVTNDWLDRLKAAAYSSPDVGTVSPLGENASVMSYPRTQGQTRSGDEVSQIDLLARRVNKGQTVEIPVGVGFCFYVKRACLNEVGPFDEFTFGKGYGEESDFCLRARRLEWRHCGAADVFVSHQGGLSFGDTRVALLERNGRIIETLHPDYDGLVQDFVKQDALFSARRAIDMARITSEVSKPVLIVSIALPGGLKRHVEDRRQERYAEQSVVLLRGVLGGGQFDQVRLEIPGNDLQDLLFSMKTEDFLLRDLLLKLDLKHIEIHGFVELPSTALELLTELGVPYSAHIHDYSWICPRVTLLGGNGVYCGEPELSECERCIQVNGTELDPTLSVAALRERSSRMLKLAATITVPSLDTAERMQRYFTTVAIRVEALESVQPLQSREYLYSDVPLRVAVIGAIGKQKGYDILLNCARDAADRGLDTEFVIFGYTYDDDLLMATGHAFVTGRYLEHEIQGLLEREQCRMAFFPSVTPETWCYSLTHAMRRSLPVVAFDLGAIAERLICYPAATLIPLTTAAAEINDILVQQAQMLSNSRETEGTQYGRNIVSSRLS